MSVAGNYVTIVFDEDGTADVQSWTNEATAITYIEAHLHLNPDNTLYLLRVEGVFHSKQVIERKPMLTTFHPVSPQASEHNYPDD